MALIRTLPIITVSSLLLDSLDIEKLKSAFHNEETQRTSRIPGHLEKDCLKKKKASEQAGNK
jgi:hypothetical protein